MKITQKKQNEHHFRFSDSWINSFEHGMVVHISDVIGQYDIATRYRVIYLYILIVVTQLVETYYCSFIFISNVTNVLQGTQNIFLLTIFQK